MSAVFTGRTLLLMIVATLLRKPDATWADFHLTAAQLGLDLSQTAVEKRFAAGQPLVDFFRNALERALQQDRRRPSRLPPPCSSGSPPSSSATPPPSPCPTSWLTSSKAAAAAKAPAVPP